MAPAPQPRARLAVLLFACLVGVYLSNLRALTSGDNIPARLLPFSILRQHALTLDEFPRLRSADGRLMYFTREIGGHLYANTSIALPIVITPLYIAPAAVLSAFHIPYDDVRAQLMIDAMERISAAAIAAASAAVLYVTLAATLSPVWGLSVAAVYALGTSTFAISSQALWPHGLMQLCVALLCWAFLVPPVTRAKLMIAGLAAAIAVAERLQMFPVALIALVFVCVHHRRQLAWFAAVPALGAVLLLTYNLRMFQGVAGAYQTFNHFSNPLLTGLAGLLLSPNRGLLIFTPAAMIGFYGAVVAWRGPRPWLRYATIAAACELVLYGKFDEWWAGYTYGPRYATDILPILALLAAEALPRLWRRTQWRVAIAALALYGVGVQAIGVYCDDDDWNRRPVPLEQRPARVWDWADLQIARALQSGWHGSELWPLLTTAFDDPVPATLRMLTPADLAAQFDVLDPPQHLQHGSQRRLSVRVSNRGAQAWPAFTGDFDVYAKVHLIARWMTGSQPVSGVGGIVGLPKNVCPGESVRVELPVSVPPVPGDYQLELLVAQAIDGRRGISGASVDDLSVIVD